MLNNEVSKEAELSGSAVGTVETGQRKSDELQPQHRIGFRSRLMGVVLTALLSACGPSADLPTQQAPLEEKEKNNAFKEVSVSLMFGDKKEIFTSVIILDPKNKPAGIEIFIQPKAQDGTEIGDGINSAFDLKNVDRRLYMQIGTLPDNARTIISQLIITRSDGSKFEKKFEQRVDFPDFSQR